MATNHYNMSELYRLFSEFGRNIEDDELRYPGNEAMATSALLRLVSIVDCVCEGIAHAEYRAINTAARKGIYDAYGAWLSAEQAKHGPAPEELVEWMQLRCERLIDGVVCYAMAIRSRSPRCDFHFNARQMPADVRRAYDRWRKRRKKANGTST